MKTITYGDIQEGDTVRIVSSCGGVTTCHEGVAFRSTAYGEWLTKGGGVILSRDSAEVSEAVYLVDRPKLRLPDHGEWVRATAKESGVEVIGKVWHGYEGKMVLTTDNTYVMEGDVESFDVIDWVVR